MNQVIVNTNCGRVRGKEREGVQIFAGIPYGTDCSGQNRFLPALPAEGWSGIRDCTKNGTYAVQPGSGVCASPMYGDYFSGGHPEIFGVLDEVQSEDCLCLNVMTPKADDQKRPVVVYFHGGGLIAGNGSIVLGADCFVKEQDLVVVGVNHRLNVFGYLYLGEYGERYQSSGIAGILDLVLALHWVHDNIEAFGGDPEKVTIMGESGGGMKVSCLLNMPEARGLFRYAIIESGAMPLRFTRDEASEVTRNILGRLQIDAAHIAKLYDIPANELMKAADPDFMRLRPVADGIHLTECDKGRYTTELYDKTVPLLLGISEDECAIDWKPMDITNDNLKSLLCTIKQRPPMASKTRQYTEDQLDRMIDCVQAISKRKLAAEELFWRISSVTEIGDIGAYQLAHERITKRAAPVYMYVNRFDAPHWRDPEKKFSWHTFDLPLQFGIVRDPECEMVSKNMREAWGSFIRNGIPAVGSVQWPVFEPVHQYTMIFDDHCYIEEKPMEALVKLVTE